MDVENRTHARVRGTPGAVHHAARALRREMTPAEQHLWTALRKQQVRGLRFRRQHPLGTFVLDFCCPAHKLVVEVDGNIHDQEDLRLRDELGTEQLTAFGYRVLRFRNEEIFGSLESVLHRIIDAVSPPSDAEEG